jgi:hypothetical protein
MIPGIRQERKKRFFLDKETFHNILKLYYYFGTGREP